MTYPNDQDIINKALSLLRERLVVPTKGEKVTTPEEASQIFLLSMEPFQRDGQETVHALFLDTGGRIITLKMIHKGSLTFCPFHPRDIVREALLCKAASVIISHNHPSGDLSPSPEDISMTKTLMKALKLFKIPLHDHIIVGDTATFSLREEGHTGLW